MTDWRKDENWQLVAHDPAVFKRQPPKLPPKTAELCADGRWASVFDADGRAVATWLRTIGLTSPGDRSRLVAKRDRDRPLADSVAAALAAARNRATTSPTG